jgi:hypothetical protein
MLIYLMRRGHASATIGAPWRVFDTLLGHFHFRLFLGRGFFRHGSTPFTFFLLLGAVAHGTTYLQYTAHRLSL